MVVQGRQNLVHAKDFKKPDTPPRSAPPLAPSAPSHTLGMRTGLLLRKPETSLECEALFRAGLKLPLSWVGEGLTAGCESVNARPATQRLGDRFRVRFAFVSWFSHQYVMGP